MAKQLNEFISRKGLLNVNQSAYKSSHSTETALLKIQNDIAFSVDSGKAVALTLLDLSAAFDMIYHHRSRSHQRVACTKFPCPTPPKQYLSVGGSKESGCYF